MENVWKDGIARCTRLNRLKSIIFLWFSAHEKILHEKLFQETRSRWSVFFSVFRTIWKISKYWNRSKGLLFLNFPFENSVKAARRKSVSTTGKMFPNMCWVKAIGKGRGGESGNRQAGNNEGKKREKRRGREGKIEEPLTFMQTMGEHRFRRYFRSSPFPKLSPWSLGIVERPRFCTFGRDLITVKASLLPVNEKGSALYLERHTLRCC